MLGTEYMLNKYLYDDHVEDLGPDFAVLKRSQKSFFFFFNVKPSSSNISITMQAGTAHAEQTRSAR